MSQMLAEVIYPESDGMPMADNPNQLRLMTAIAGGIGAEFLGRDDVCVYGDVFWYPVEGEPEIRVAPDVMVIFGRPKKPPQERRSWLQWQEGGIGPSVVFEIYSNSNTAQEMADKTQFYNDYGVLEYITFNPDGGALNVYTRGLELLRRIPLPRGQFWTSPLMGIRMGVEDDDLVLFSSDGNPFHDYIGGNALAWSATADAERERQRADDMERRADEQTRVAEEQRRQRERERQRADEQTRVAEEQRRRADESDRLVAEQNRMVERMRERMRLSGIDPDAIELE